MLTFSNFIDRKDFNLITESLSSAKKTFVQTNKISNDVFISLVNIDTSKQKKYLDMICSYYLEGISIEVIKEYINLFDVLTSKNIIKQKDINKYSTFSSLEIDVNKSKVQKSNNEIKNIKKQEVDVILDNSELLIVIPRSHASSCIYGSGTKWCTTSKDDNTEWNKYNRYDITLYYIYDKKISEYDTMYKVAVAVYPDGKKECFDALDDELNFEYILKYFKLKSSMFVSSININIDKYINGTYTIDSNGFYNIKGDVDLEFIKMKKIPFKFGIVTGDFSCNNNELINLEGSPKEVGGSFHCYENKLTSLEGSPEKVGINFNCMSNNLTSLEGSPKKVGKDYTCSYNNLTSLEGSPREIGGMFNCHQNKLTSFKNIPQIIANKLIFSNNLITSLEGCPVKVTNGFDFTNCKLTTLKGSPEKVYNNFDVTGNYLTSLEGSPREIIGTFSCASNNLTSLEGSPKEVQYFICSNNKVKFTREDVRNVCNVSNSIDT